ncbi:MAG: M20/M25/M40 family metallo-hydrolase, partial [Anaerolineales bacterium]|nr:M20/M25/M40 family metallo-hydrolase [Anaerolineales bacterium]
VSLTRGPSPAGRGETLTPGPSPVGRGEALTPSPSPEGRGETLTPSPSPEGRGVLYGRGAVDAKGPLACFTDAVARVGAVEGWQFVVIGAVEEERDSDGARFLVDKYRPDFLIVGEPNRWDRIALGYKGSAWAEITVRRVQSHTASGEQTAAEAAVEAWLAIRAFAESFNAEKQRAFDKILPTLRNIEAGQDGFAQWARLSVGVRLPVEMPPEQWYARLREIVSDAEMQPVGYAVPAWGCEKNTPLVRALLSGIRSQGGSPSFVYKTGTADLNIVAPVWQCPAVVYGPGDSALDHTPHEHISLEEYEKAVEVLAAALMNLVENQSKP